jgi:hypothetical protein
MFSQVLLKSLPKSVLSPWRAVLTAGFPKVWANIPRLLVDPFVLESRSFAPFRFRHDLARRPLMPRMNILNAVEQEAFESAPVFNSFQRKQYFDFQVAQRSHGRDPKKSWARHGRLTLALEDRLCAH